MRGHFFDCPRHVSQIAGAVGAQRAHILGGAHRMMHHRPLAGLKLEVQAHRLQRQQQVGKDDGRVHAQLFRGGDGHLGGQLRLLADFHQRVVLAHVAVLLHVAARPGAETTPACGPRAGAGRRGQSGCRAKRFSPGVLARTGTLLSWFHMQFILTGRKRRIRRYWRQSLTSDHCGVQEHINFDGPQLL